MTDEQGYSRDVHQYLDGEAVEPIDAAQRAEADALLEAVGSYGDSLAPPGPEVDDNVMRVVVDSATRAGFRDIWNWLVQPQPTALRPVLALAAVVILAVVFTLGGRGADPLPVTAPPVRAAPRQSVQATDLDLPDIPLPRSALVRFELSAPLASRVALVGSFNDWVEPGVPLTPNAQSGVWTVTVPLPLGAHRYGFLVNGNTWTPDPTAHAQVDDGFGRTNSVLVVGPRGVSRP